MQDVLPFSSNEGEGCEESHQAHKRGVVTSPALLVHHADVLATFLVEGPAIARNAAEDNDGKYLKKKKKSFFCHWGPFNKKFSEQPSIRILQEHFEKNPSIDLVWIRMIPLQLNYR